MQVHGVRLDDKPLILIVEDSPLIAWDMQKVLEGAGYRVVGPAPSFERAMELIDAFHPQIVLLDIELSGPKNGVAIARELLKRHIPALFVSGVMPNDPDAKQSAVGLVSKPVDEQKLLASVRLVQEIAAGKTPTNLPSGFERYDWRPERNGKSA